jgi:hypothetical protein
MNHRNYPAGYSLHQADPRQFGGIFTATGTISVVAAPATARFTVDGTSFTHCPDPRPGPASNLDR